MVSKTSLREVVRAHRWQEVADSLAERPDLKNVHDERGRNWLHLACMVPGEDEACLRTADVLLEFGYGIDDAAFTEGSWRATPLWHVISRGRNLRLAEHLLRLGANPNYCLFAAVWNEDLEGDSSSPQTRRRHRGRGGPGGHAVARRRRLEQIRACGGAAQGRSRSQRPQCGRLHGPASDAQEGQRSGAFPTLRPPWRQGERSRSRRSHGRATAASQAGSGLSGGRRDDGGPLTRQPCFRGAHRRQLPCRAPMRPDVVQPGSRALR